MGDSPTPGWHRGVGDRRTLGVRGARFGNSHRRSVEAVRLKRGSPLLLSPLWRIANTPRTEGRVNPILSLPPSGDTGP